MKRHEIDFLNLITILEKGAEALGNDSEYVDFDRMAIVLNRMLEGDILIIEYLDKDEEKLANREEISKGVIKDISDLNKAFGLELPTCEDDVQDSKTFILTLGVLVKNDLAKLYLTDWAVKEMFQIVKNW